MPSYYMTSSVSRQDEPMCVYSARDFSLGPARSMITFFGVLSHIINPLLIKLVRWRRLDIVLVGQYPAILTSCLVNNPYVAVKVSLRVARDEIYLSLALSWVTEKSTLDNFWGKLYLPWAGFEPTSPWLLVGSDDHYTIRTTMLATWLIDHLMCHWCSYHILTSSVIYYWTDARQHGIYFFYIIKN